MEEEIEHPVSLPEDVLQILRQDKDNQRSLEDNQTPNEMPASWFVASQISLNNDSQPDLIVMGVGPLRGANITPFWVFNNSLKGYKLVLMTATHSLTILDARTKGHRQIKTAAMTAVDVHINVYKFNGREYQVQHSLREPI
jgi:hypothetical protein